MLDYRRATGPWVCEGPLAVPRIDDEDFSSGMRASVFPSQEPPADGSTADTT